MSPLFSGKRSAKTPRVIQEVPWPIRFTGRLLGLQSVVFFIAGIYTAPQPPVLAHEFNELSLAAFYVFLAFLCAWAALGLLRLRSSAWNLAMLLEGASLLHALLLYLNERPFFIYIQMLFGILAVLNLNQPALRRSFPTEIIESHTEIHEAPSL